VSGRLAELSDRDLHKALEPLRFDDVAVDDRGAARMVANGDDPCRTWSTLGMTLR
jgi:hypothetical protein